MKKGWEVKTLGDLLDVQNGYAFSSENFSRDAGKPLIRIRDLKRGNETEVKYVGDFDPDYLVKRGDFLIGMDGEFLCHEWKGEDALLNQRVCRLNTFSNKLLPRFLFHGINRYLKEIEDVTAFTTVKHLSSKTIKSIEFPLPPLEEQLRIVAILDEAFEGLDRARANAEANLQSAKELFENFREDYLDPRNKTGWTYWTIGDLVTIKHGFAFKSEFFVDRGEFAVLTPGNFHETGGFRDRGEKQRYYSGDFSSEFILKKDDLLMAMTEQAPGLLGSSLVVPHHGEFLHNQRLGLITPKEKMAWHPAYFAHAFNLKDFRQALSDTCSGATVRHTSPGRILAQSIPYINDLDVLEETAITLTQMEGKCRYLEFSYRNTIDDIFYLRQSLLQKAFVGELT